MKPIIDIVLMERFNIKSVFYKLIQGTILLILFCIIFYSYAFRIRSTSLVSPPKEVIRYVDKNLSNWRYLWKSDLITDWRDFIPEVTEPTMILGDFTNDSIEDFAVMLFNDSTNEASLFVFNNFSEEIEVFKLDYYVAVYGEEIGSAIYRDTNTLKQGSGFVVEKFESSKAICRWYGMQYQLNFISD